MQKGLFITVEGTDGSGKTTQIKLMESYLKDKGYDVIVTRDPGGTNISEEIRSIVLNPVNTEMGKITEMLLYASARAQMVYEVINPAIESGKMVICDRFVDSSYVYQGFGRGLNLKIVSDVNRIAMQGVAPDITFFFDINPEVTLKRRIATTGADRIEKEKMEFHMEVYNGYRKLAMLYPERIKSIDSNRTIDEVFNEVKGWLRELLGWTPNK